MEGLSSNAEDQSFAVLTEEAEQALKAAVATGDPERIAAAVTLFESIEVNARQAKDPQYWKALINLVGALMHQAEADPSEAAFDRLLDMLDRNEDRFRSAENRYAYLDKRGRALLMKAQRTNDPATMHQAVKTQKERVKRAPRQHPDYTASRLALGITLLHSNATSGHAATTAEAVAVLIAARDRPDPSVQRAAVHSALGNAFLRRFLRLSHDETDLYEALREHQDAAATAEPDDPDLATYLSDAGGALMHAYTYTGRRTMLNSSIERHREAARHASGGPVQRAERFSNLAAALLTVYEADWDPAVLDEAISAGRDAVGSARPGSGQHTSALYGLAGTLFRRGELRRTLFDLDEAAELSALVVRATPAGDQRLPTRMAFYAQASCLLPSQPKLRKAVQDLRDAEQLLAAADPNRAMLQANRGALMEALAQLLPPSDPQQRQLTTEAVDLTRRGVDTTSAQHSEYTARLINYLGASTALARLDHDVAVLDDPLQRSTIAQAEGAPVHPMLPVAHAAALACRFELTADPDLAASALEAYDHALADPRLDAYGRLLTAHEGAELAARQGEADRALQHYRHAVELLDTVVWRGLGRRDQERLLEQYAHLPRDAAAIAITASQPQAAVELLEQGRGVLLGRLVDDSADLAQLTTIDPQRAQRFRDLRARLEEVVIPDLDPNNAEIIDLPPRQYEQASVADQRSRLARELETLIEEIRAIPDCNGLFQAPHFADLHAAIGTRSIAMINVSAYRCDALVITPQGVRAKPLASLTQSDTEEAAVFFRTRAQIATRSTPEGERAREKLNEKLAWLWDTVAAPVLHDLAMDQAPSSAEEPRRMYWCPTGPAVFLPLHAAGHHRSRTAPAPLTVIDCTESVYIAKLHALTSDETAPESVSAPLIVSMPETPENTPLTNAETEACRLLEIFPDATHLTGSTATRQAVLTAMASHTWFHFAAHGTVHSTTPTEGGLELYDGRLTIHDLLQQHPTHAEFAYLSACSTYQGARNLPDESVTVATALNIAGCRHVIATMWSVADSDAAAFAHGVYEHLIDASQERPVLHSQQSAYAVRETARVLRDAQPDRPERWSAFALSCGL